MKKFTADNLLLFRKHFNQLYHLIRNRERNAEHYRITETRSGHTGLEIVLTEKVSSMYSKYDPYFEVSRWLETIEQDIGNAKHIFLFGFGLGYHAEHLLEKYSDRTFYILEPDLECMLAALEARDLSPILKSNQISLMAIGREMKIFNEVSTLLAQHLNDSFVALYSPFYTKNYKSDMEHFMQIFRHAVMVERGNVHTQLKFKNEWPINHIMNIAYSLRSRPLVNITNIFENTPIIIVGSGPSLNDDISLLQTLQHHVPIIAAGTSVQALLSAHIKPHLIVSIDGSENNYKAFKDLDLKDICYAYAPISSYKIVGKLNKEYIYHYPLKAEILSNYLLGLKDSDVLLQTQATVSAVALQMALLMGSPKILLIGQDLSYPGGVAYAQGVNHFSDEEIEKSKLKMPREIENVKGGMNLTTASMELLLAGIQNVTMTLGQGRTIVNCSQSGAKIKGTIHTPLVQLANELKAYNIDHKAFKEVLDSNNHFYDHSKQKNIIQRMMEVKSEIECIRQELVLPSIQAIIDLKKSLENQDRQAMQYYLGTVDILWGKISSHKLFIPVVCSVLSLSMTVYNKFLPSIQKEQDLIKKCELVIQHLGTLMTVMNKDFPQIISIFDMSLIQIED